MRGRFDPPKPVPAYVQAARNRRRVPFWAMPVLAAVPLWGYVFFRTLEPPPVENDPLVLGEELYSSCAGCHGGSGQGVSAPALADGAVLETWNDYRDHMMWVRLGSDGWPAPTYGGNDTPTGEAGTMPPHPGLSDEEQRAMLDKDYDAIKRLTGLKDGQFATNHSIRCYED